MSIDIGGYAFEGPYDSVDKIKEDIGVYVILCFVDGKPHCVLDIGTSEGGLPYTRKGIRTVTHAGNLRYRLRLHKRKECWKENAHGTIRYAVRYISDTSERLSIERELQWKFDYACGDKYWKKVELAWQEYREFKRRFGPRGQFKL